MKKLVLAISMGCPSGIGPEVTLGALRVLWNSGSLFSVVIFGDLALLRARARLVDFDVSLLREFDTSCYQTEAAVWVQQVGEPLSATDSSPGRLTPLGGAAQLAYIHAAMRFVHDGLADALVTGPVSKLAIVSSRAKGSAAFIGHTEYLGSELHAADTLMTFWSEELTIAVATTHVALRDVPSLLTVSRLARAIGQMVEFVDLLKIRLDKPVAVLSLNPHAGEGGLFGSEERTIIAPAIDEARCRLAKAGSSRTVVGPIPAESAIRLGAREKAYAACLAMYHDQATIASKLLSFGDAVNVTLGLPIIRTSVDHGTAYDLAGTGKADVAAMCCAINLALRLALAKQNIELRSESGR